jgi:hypothetical protein
VRQAGTASRRAALTLACSARRRDVLVEPEGMHGIVLGLVFLATTPARLIGTRTASGGVTSLDAACTVAARIPRTAPRRRGRPRHHGSLAAGAGKHRLPSACPSGGCMLSPRHILYHSPGKAIVMLPPRRTKCAPRAREPEAVQGASQRVTGHETRRRSLSPVAGQRSTTAERASRANAGPASCWHGSLG